MHRTSCRPSPCWKSRRHDSLRRGIRQNEGRRRSEKTRSVLDASVSGVPYVTIVLSLLFLVMTGTGLYSAVVDSQTRNREARAALSYLAARVHAADAAGAVSVGEGPEGAALLLRENADGETYETRIYLYEGALREEYGTADAALDPQDSERIVDAKSFSVEQVRPGLLVVSTEYGSADIALRSGLARMRRSRGGAAFYVETLLLVLFLLASLTVLVQILGAAKRTSREARELSTAVSIAQNAAELFAASGSREDFAALLGAEKTARGTLRAAYDVQGGWTEDETQGAYVLEAVLDETPRQAGEMRTAHFVVTAADGDTVLYELDTQKYIGG